MHTWIVDGSIMALIAVSYVIAAQYSAFLPQMYTRIVMSMVFKILRLFQFRLRNNLIIFFAHMCFNLQTRARAHKK